MARTRFTVKEGISVADDNVVGGYPLIPVGGLMPYAGATSPEGWLLCDGAVISRTTYANLFALIGATYGSGNGTTTFNVPDMRSRMPMGAGVGAGLTSRALAATGGAESVVIASGNLPTHTHTTAHTHGTTIATTTALTATGAPDDNTTAGPNDNTSDGPNDNTSDDSGVLAHLHNIDHYHNNFNAIGAGGHAHGVYYVTDIATGTAKNRVSATGSSVSSGAVESVGDHVHTSQRTLTMGETGYANSGQTGQSGVQHSHTMKSHTHTMKSHTHTMKSHTHGFNHGHTGTTSSQSDSNSGDGGFANTALGLMNPFLSVNYIIKY
jgi:microcystin-dependent protein